MGAGPLRTCVSCRTVRPKAELILVVRAPGGGLWVGPQRRGRPPGRGAYVCLQASCIEAALRSKLARALRLRGPLPQGVVQDLRQRVAGAGARAAQDPAEGRSGGNGDEERD